MRRKGTFEVYASRSRDVNRAIRRSAAISMCLTPCSILLVNLDYGLVFSEPLLALEAFNAWPWFRASVALTVITILWPFFAIWSSGAYGADGHRYSNTLYAWSLGLIWLAPFAFFPTVECLPERLPVSYESLGFTWLLVVFSQNVALRSLAQVLWHETYDETYPELRDYPL